MPVDPTALLKGLKPVEPAEDGTYPRWMGRPVLLDRALCQAMRTLLVDDSIEPSWSRRARAVLSELRAAHSPLREARAPLISEPGFVKWWTFAGGRANGLLAALLQERLGTRIRANNLFVSFSGDAAQSEREIHRGIEDLANPGVISWDSVRRLAPGAARRRISKFQPCLPEQLELDLVAGSLMDLEGARKAVAEGCGGRDL